MIIEEIRILHLEDSETDAAHINRVLKKAEINCTIRIVASRSDYILELRDFKPDIVLSDHNMPSFNSLEALEILHTSGIDIPFILLTGTVSEEFAVEVMLKGADDYILKDRPKRLPIAILNAIEKHKHRRERERKEAELRNIFDGSVDVLCSVDREGRFANVSAAAEKTWGYKPAELVGKKYMDLVYEADHEATSQIAANIMAGLSVTNFDNHYIHKNGNIVPMTWSARWDADAEIMYAVARDGTEKVKAEKAILSERKRLLDLFTDAPVNICMFAGEDHVFEMVNRLSHRQINRDVLGKKYKDALPEFDQQGFTKLLDRVYQTGMPFEAKEMLIKVAESKDDKVVDNYVNMLLQPYLDNEGRIAGVCYFGVYVTEQVAARRKIEENYEMLKSAETLQSSILNALPVQIALLDSEGNIIAVNQSWKNFATENNLKSPNYGIGENYIRTSDLARGAAAESGLKMATGIKDVIKGKKKIFSLEYRCDSPTEKRWFQTRVAPTGHGEDRGAVVIHINTTERKLAEEKIKTSEANLAAIIENADAHIYSLDREFRYITFNSMISDSMLAAYGIEIKPGDKVYSFLEKMDPAEAKWWEGIYTEALTGKTMRFVKDYSTPDLPNYINFSINPIVENGDIIGLSCFARDITEIKEAELAIRKMNETLEQRVLERTAELTEANKELEAFSGTVSHDLRAPARAVTKFAEIIREEYGGKMEPKEKELLHYIEDSGQRMTAIIDDLLKLAKYGNEILKLEQVDMTRLVQNSWLNISKLEPHKAEFEIQELGTIEVDMSMMQQVVVNLLSNAIKYSSKKEKPVVTVWCERKAEQVTFYFKDNGAGFDMKNYDRLFGAFQRFHNSRDFSGTGVGLTLVKRVIEKHGGTVGAEAKVGVGATFYFSIPGKINNLKLQE